jgi:hypothetical protein
MKAFDGIFGSEQSQWAMSFTVPNGSNFLFTGFDVPLTFAGTTTTVDFTLASDAGGAPGVALETIGIALSNGTAIYSGSSSLHPDLIAGTSYWLEAAIPLSFVGTEADWNAASGLFSGMALGPVAFRSPPLPLNWQVTTNSQAAFEIDGTAGPEPRYAWVMVFGCLLAGRRAFRLYRSSRVYRVPASQR